MKLRANFLCCLFLVHLPVTDLLGEIYTQKFQRIVQETLKNLSCSL